MRLIDADALLERMKKAMESGSNLNGTFHLYIEHAPTIPRPTGECSGCKFIGSYDTDFPCVNCVRKMKDYYCGERMRGEDGEE